MVAVLGVMTALVGCGSDTAPTPPLAPCSGALTVSVTSGTTPTISWSPACGVNRLSVDLVDAPAGTVSTVWGLVTSSSDEFGPSVRYGVVPNGATADPASAPLQAGKSYRVQVLRAGGEAIILAQGTTTFTP
jgi:hypothetical protein